MGPRVRRVDGLLEAAEGLYALPLADFTPRRDALARELRPGDATLAAAVKKLRKPSLAAWVVNLLVRRDAGQVEQVLGVGAALREAQASLAGEELRALTRQRRQLTAAVTARARGLAAEHGQRVTDAVAEQVEATLTAAMVDQEAAAAVRTGLLVGALAATGVDAVDVAGALAVPDALGHVPTALEEPGPPPPQLRLVEDPEAGARAVVEAESRVAEARRAVERAQQAAAAAADDVAALQARSLQLGSEIEEHRRAIADLETQGDRVDDELADAEQVREDADSSLAAARHAHDQARAALAALASR